jgi:V/A-type H+-transporting ATPase subunit D
MDETKLWDVRVPEIKEVRLSRSALERGYAPVTISSRIDLTAQQFENVVELLVLLAPLEIRLKRLGEEIKKTTRRVNALEQKVIPELKAQVKFIRQVLEDREREDKFRLKRLKGKKVSARA